MNDRLFIIDLKELLDSYVKYGTLYDVYRHYPLRKMVSNLLTFEIDYQEVLWFDMEVNINSETLDGLNLENLEVFYDILAEDLDQHMSRQLGKPFQHTECRFIEWVDNTSIILKEM